MRAVLGILAFSRQFKREMSKLRHAFDFEEPLVYSGVKAGSFSTSSQAAGMSRVFEMFIR
jgi:hypothetical protein